MIAFIASMALTIVVGALIVRLILSGANARLDLIASLGAAAGMGFASSLYFVLLNISPQQSISLWWMVELSVFAVLVIANWRVRAGTPRTPGSLSEDEPELLPQRVRRWFCFGYIGLLIVGTVSFWTKCWLHPHSDWDALMIWNVRARFLERAPLDLHHAFNLLIHWTHLDYPLLLPSIVGFGLALTNESQVSPAVVAYAFTMATVFVLQSALSVLRTRTYGFLAGIVLLTTPYWVDCGTMLYADVPLACYFLSALVCCAFYDRVKHPGYLALAGMFASMGAWTKNEGMLFILCLLLVSALVGGGIKLRLKPLLVALAGALPVFLVLIWFKLSLAPANDLVAGQSSGTLERLLNPTRFIIVCQYFLVYSVTFGNWFVSPIPLFVLFWIGTRSQLNNTSAKRSFFTAVLVILGYFLVFLTSPAADMQQHLAHAAKRLFLQLWPSCIFALVGSLSLDPSVLFAQATKKGAEKPA